MEKYTIDIKGSNDQFSIGGLHVGDCKTRRLVFCLTCGAEPYPAPDGCIATLYAVLPDGLTTVYVPCTVEDGNVIFDPEEKEHFLALCATEGEVRCEIRIIFPDERTLTTPEFSLYVYSVLQNDSAIEAHSDFSALTAALVRVLEAESGLDSKVDKVHGASGSLATFTENGDLSDSGLGIDDIPDIFVFEFCEKGSEADTKNRETFYELKAHDNTGSRYVTFIKDEGERLFPCTARRVSENRYVLSALVIDDDVLDTFYYVISVSPFSTSYAKEHYLSQAFDENDICFCATQAATAEWVKALIDESIAEGEW